MSIRDTLKKLAAPKIIECGEVDGDKVYLKAMSGEIRAQYVALCQDRKDSVVSPSQVCSFGLCDADGNIEFTLETASELNKLDGKFLQDTAMKLLDISGLLPKGDEDAKKK